MDFTITTEELGALCGLPHIQQLVYLRGIRPYMDLSTGLVGIKRRISHQSIAEQLYIEPQPGIKEQNFSRAQVRRAVAGLVRAGLLESESEGLHLILKCLLASRSYSVQNKAVINPSQKAVLRPSEKNLANIDFSEAEAKKADIADPPKAGTPLNKDNFYIYLSTQFDKFWTLYPEKKSRDIAEAAFEALNPSEELCKKIIQALESQIHHRNTMKLQGLWVPPWKYPANWLNERRWEDVLTTEVLEGVKDEKHAKDIRKSDRGQDPFSPPCDDEEPSGANIVQLTRYL